MNFLSASYLWYTPLENFSLSPDQKYALIFGNEVKGVQQEVIDLSDGCIEIPQFGTKHSFNTGGR